MKTRKSNEFSQTIVLIPLSVDFEFALVVTIFDKDGVSVRCCANVKAVGIPTPAASIIATIPFLVFHGILSSK